MTELQQHLLGMLQEIDEICLNNNLHYYLGGGCLIGALRHRGFLPWDDDADIHMMHSDAQKLCEIANNNELPPHRALISPQDKESTISWIRYVDTSSTTLIRSSYHTEETPQGVFIDIVPLDPAPESEEQFESFLNQKRLHAAIHNLAYIFKGVDVPNLITWRKWQHIASVIGRKKAAQIIWESLSKESSETSEMVFVRSADLPVSMPHACFVPRNWFGNPRRVAFEDTELCIPEKAELFLTNAFGSSWIDIPTSPSIRKPEHLFLTDQFFPSQDVLHDIDSLSPLSVARFLDKGIKKAYFNYVPYRVTTQQTTAEAEVLLASLEINKAWKEAGFDLDELEHTQDFQEVEAFFNRYYRMLRWPRLTNWNLMIPLEDDTLWAAWYPLSQKGNYRGALKAINYRIKHNNEPLSPRLEQLLKDCTDADALVTALWSEGDYKRAFAIAHEHKEDSHPSIVFQRGILASMALNATELSDFKQVHTLAKSHLVNHPGDGEMAYWDAIALKAMDDRDGAIAGFRKAADHAANGIVRLLAQDELNELQEKAQS